jgi:hypothetical protein
MPSSASQVASASGSSLWSVPSSAPPLPAPSGTSAGSGAAGVAFSTLFALLLSFAAFGLRHFTRVRLVPLAWRQQAFVAVIERPG